MKRIASFLGTCIFIPGIMGIILGIQTFLSPSLFAQFAQPAQPNPAGTAPAMMPGTPPAAVPASVLPQRPAAPPAGTYTPPSASGTQTPHTAAVKSAEGEACDKDHGTQNLNFTFKPDGDFKLPPAEALQRFIVLYKQFDALSDEFDALSEKYEDAEDYPAEQARMEPRLSQLSKITHDLYHELQDLVEPAWIANPQQEEVASFLLFLMASALDEDQYEVAYELARELMSKNVHKDEPILYEMTGISAFMINRHDIAELCFREAKANDELTAEGVAIQGMLPYYKLVWKQESALREKDAEAGLPRVLLQTTKGNIVLELFEDQAPNTVANFIFLTEKGFYNDNDFHTVIAGFMAQSGSPNPDGTGTPGYAIPDESAKPDARKHLRGSLSMAMLGPNTAGSQFFITLVPTGHLDGKYTVFGRVIQGIDVVSALERIDVSDEDGETESGLDEPDKIIKATVLRKRDHEYVPKVIQLK